MEEKTICHSDNTHYLDVFFFDKDSVTKHQVHWCQEKDATNFYQRGINKYKELKNTVLICIRDKNHLLIKAQLINPFVNV